MPTLCVGNVEERIVQRAGVVQVEHPAAHFVDLVGAQDVRIGKRDGRIAVGALQRERGREAVGVRERIQTGEVRVEARWRSAGCFRVTCPSSFSRVLVLRELRGDDIALANKGIPADGRPGSDVIADHRATSARRRNDEVAGDRIPEVQQVHRDIRDARCVAGPAALRLGDRLRDTPG